MTDQWWSWMLGAFGIIGLYLVTRKLWSGFAIGLLVQFLWLAYAIATKQYGFVMTALAYGAVNTLGLINWAKEDKRCSVD